MLCSICSNEYTLRHTSFHQINNTNTPQTMSDNIPTSPQKPEIAMTTLFKPSLYGGRFTRKQYILYILPTSLIFGVLCTIIISAIAATTFTAMSIETDIDASMKEFEQFCQLASLVLTIPAGIFIFLPMAIKRAHDIGHKGTLIVAIWSVSQVAQLLGTIADPDLGNMLSMLIFIPGLIYGCMLLFKDSEKGTNAYGTSTKYPDTTA